MLLPTIREGMMGTVVLALLASCHRDEAMVQHEAAAPSAWPSASAAASAPASAPVASASAKPPTPSNDQTWCLSPKGKGDDVNDVVVPPFKISGAKASAQLLASVYAKSLVDGGKLQVEALYCPDPKRCASAITPEEKRAACDYVMRLYVYDPALRALGGRPVMYLDIDDHVDAVNDVLWREDGASWTSEKLP